jgi:hypothetical protein
VDDASFHATCDGYDLAGDVARESIRREDDDLCRDVLWLRDLAQSHRPREPAHLFL